MQLASLSLLSKEVNLRFNVLIERGVDGFFSQRCLAFECWNYFGWVEGLSFVPEGQYGLSFLKEKQTMKYIMPKFIFYMKQPLYFNHSKAYFRFGQMCSPLIAYDSNIK